MDFDETPDEASFRAEAHAFLVGAAAAWGGGGGHLMSFTDHEAELAYVARCRDWQRIKAEHGWAGITWPTAYGGRGGTGIQDGVFAEEEARFVDVSGMFSIGVGMAGPTLITHGTEEQKQRFLRRMLRGDDIWCQLFSEPGAGSDLGSLRTSAVRDGDEWVVNGQKVWTSGAHVSDWGILLARTNPEAPKHRGITYFLVDMRTSGIEVRPLRQITGAAHFNEVFLTDVRIPRENVVGQVDAGWGPMMTTLSNERAHIGGQSRRSVGDLVELARRLGRADDPVVRQELARAHTREQLLTYLGYRVRTAVTRGELPGPESSVMKLGLSQHLARTGDLVMSLLGPGAALWGDDALDEGRFQMEFLLQWAPRIGGGTDEIQRNTIGEKVLRLPPEPRVDKGIAFRDIPT
jgi:alkylation response protein AidB-like acyl-CoA dehydrogenase